MKYLITILFLSVCFSVFSQEDTSKYAKYPNTYGPQYRDIWATRVMRLPDTTGHRPMTGAPGAIGRNAAGTALFIWDGSAWQAISGGGGSSTWQQTLINGSDLSQDNTVLQGQHNFDWNIDSTAGHLKLSTGDYVNQTGKESELNITPSGIQSYVQNTNDELDGRINLYAGGLTLSVDDNVGGSYSSLHLDGDGTGTIKTVLDSSVDTAPNLIGIGTDGNWHKYAVGSNTPNLQQVTTVGNTTSLKINALNYDATADDIITRSSGRFFSYGSFYKNLTIGNTSFSNNTTGTGNISIGDSVLTLNTTGSNNIGIGNNILYSNTTGSNQINIGNSIYKLSTGQIKLGSYGSGTFTGTPTFNLSIDASGNIIETANGATPVTSVTGTANRITSTGGTTPVIDISGSYVGQSSITTLGTIGTGAWQGTIIAKAYLPSTTVYTDQANTYTAGMKQTFAADATNAGLKFGGVTSFPSSPAAGDVVYRSDSVSLAMYDGSKWRWANFYSGKKTYGGTVTLNAGTTAPSGALTSQYWYHIHGREVDFELVASWATPGGAVTALDFTFPSDLPLPEEDAIRTSVGDWITEGIGNSGTGTNTTAISGKTFLFKTGTGTYKFTTLNASNNVKIIHIKLSWTIL